MKVYSFKIFVTRQFETLVLAIKKEFSSRGRQPQTKNLIKKHSVKVGPGHRDPSTWSPLSKSKVGPETPLKCKKGTPGIPPSVCKNRTPYF